jgi:hypothetical protein
MDIYASELIYQGLKSYNEQKGKPCGNEVVDEEPLEPIYPLTIIQEIRNVQNPSYRNPIELVSSIGFSIEIYAQTMGDKTKKQIAREISKLVDEYMSTIGFERSGFVPDGLVRDASLHRIIMTYTGNLHENTRRII